MGIDTGLGTLLGVPKPVATSLELERETGIEPASLAWKAKVLPLNYSRSRSHSPFSLQLLFRLGGGGWIRTSVGVSQQIYSLPPLATRAPLRDEPVTIAAFEGVDPDLPPLDEVAWWRKGCGPRP